MTILFVLATTVFGFFTWLKNVIQITNSYYFHFNFHLNLNSFRIFLSRSQLFLDIVLRMAFSSVLAFHVILLNHTKDIWPALKTSRDFQMVLDMISGCLLIVLLSHIGH